MFQGYKFVVNQYEDCPKLSIPIRYYNKKTKLVYSGYYYNANHTVANFTLLSSWTLYYFTIVEFKFAILPCSGKKIFSIRGLVLEFLLLENF